VARDGRKPAPAAQENVGSTPNPKRPRQREARDEESVVDVTGGAVAGSSNVAEPLAKEATPPPVPPKKRKLPPIKKNKAPGGLPAQAPPSAAAVPPPKLPQVTASSNGPAEDASKQVRQVAANIGMADFDLRKPSVYAELFKAVSGVNCFYALIILLFTTGGREHAPFGTEEGRREEEGTS
jgi:hypothetical protein